MLVSNDIFKGLTSKEVIAARAKYGANILVSKKQSGAIRILKTIIGEPMVLLLLIAATIYLISGQTSDAIFLSIAIILISIISIYQDTRTQNALLKLQEYIKPYCKVIRNGTEVSIQSVDLVKNDIIVIEEGESIPADAVILQANDFSVNQSVITGESLPVFKNELSEDKFIFSGTTVVSGRAVAQITDVGSSTKIGQIKSGLEAVKHEKTPLEKQINSFVRKMVLTGSIFFVLIWVINFYRSEALLDSLIKALTLAMSILPEEIPVAFTAFMALGAWRLMKTGVIVKQMKTVETLGSANVICADKTGTITQNKMSLVKLYVFSQNSFLSIKETDLLSESELKLIRAAMFASESVPYDPMEKALHEAYAKYNTEDERGNFVMIHEYPLGGKPPIMTHIFENKDRKRIIAAKGAPEAFLNICGLTDKEKETIENAIYKLAGDGYRVLGVANAEWEGNHFPEVQQDFKFEFRGLVAFYDPPKDNMEEVLNSFYNAGIEVKIITGDNAVTTSVIAKEIGFRGWDKAITGEELMRLSESELKEAVLSTNIFSRMFPEAKLRIINALKANNKIVAMTGDGVNDAPALKAAHIGIAMGKKGTALAKDAASIILVEDDISKMVDAVAMGRKIYSNLKKAIQYIISIHIPIILIVFIPLVLGWKFPAIFSPVHVILLELIMGPTCSIAFENESMEKNAMSKKPRVFTSTFFKTSELIISILMGGVITAGLLAIYQFALYSGYSESVIRTMVFTTLIISNIFLTLAVRSSVNSIFTSFGYKNSLFIYIIGITLAFQAILLTVPFLRQLFQFEEITIQHLLVCFIVGAISVLWYEGVKYYKLLTNK